MPVVKKVFKLVVTGTRGSAKGKKYTRYFDSQKEMNAYLRSAGKGVKSVSDKAPAKFGKERSDARALVAKLRKAGRGTDADNIERHMELFAKRGDKTMVDNTIQAAKDLLKWLGK